MKHSSATNGIIDGNLEVNLPWTDDKQRLEESERRRERVRRKKMQVREKVETSRFTMICGSGGSNSRLAKAADAEPSG